MIDLDESVLRVERALTMNAREMLLAAVFEKNPHLRGAKVADLLFMHVQSDAFLEYVEPYWDRDAAKLAEELEGSGQLISVALRAAYLLIPPENGEYARTDELAERIVRAAFIGEQRLVGATANRTPVAGGDPRLGRIYTHADVERLVNHAFVLGRDGKGGAPTREEFARMVVEQVHQGFDALGKTQRYGELTWAPDVPLFVLCGDDVPSASAVAHYAQICHGEGVVTAYVQYATEMAAWQADNPARLRVCEREMVDS